MIMKQDIEGLLEKYYDGDTTLEEEKIGPLKLVEANDPSTAFPGYAEAVYQLALRAYVTVRPARLEDAQRPQCSQRPEEKRQAASAPPRRWRVKVDTSEGYLRKISLSDLGLRFRLSGFRDHRGIAHCAREPRRKT